MTKHFDDHSFTIDSVFGPLTVTVTGQALAALSGQGSGPQEAAGLIAAHRDMIAQIATMKFEADEGEDDHVVRVSASDLEG